MSVVIHNTTLTAGAGSVGTRVLLHTATIGSALLVWTHSNEATSCSAVAAGGVAMTRLGAYSAGTSRGELWGLSNVAGGTLTISAAQVGSNVATWNLVATSYVGQKQGGGTFGTVVAGTATAANVAFSISSTSTDLVAFGFGLSANTTVTLTTGTQRANATHSTTGRLVVGDITGASTLSISATSGASGVWGWLAVPLVATPDISSFTESFGAAMDTALWDVTTTNGSVTFSSGVAELNLSTSAAGNLAYLTTDNSFNLVGSQVYVRMISPARASADTLSVWTYFMLDATETVNQGDRIFWAVESDGTLYVAKADAFVETNISTIAANYFAAPDTYAWLRIAEAGGNVTFDYASAGASNPPISADWTNAATVTLASLPYSFRYCKISLQTYMAIAGTCTAPAKFDGLNTAANSTGSANLSATVAVTDKRDTVSAPGYVLINGQSAVTDKRDTVVAPSRLRITAAVSVTDRRDTFAATAAARITGLISVTDVRDVVAITGYNTIRGAVSVTDARDTVAVTGYVLISAIAAVVDRMDTIAVLGAPPAFISVVNVTDVPDTVAATAAVRITAFSSVTDRPDTHAADARTRITAFVNVTDNPDTIAISAYIAGGTIFSTVNITDAPDSVVATGYVLINANVGVTDRPDSAQILINNVSESAAVVTILQDLGSGGGGRKSKKPPYIRAPEDFWAVRERHLKRLQPEMVESAETAESPTTATPLAVKSVSAPKLVSYRIERASVIEKLKTVDSPPKLYNRTKRLKVLNARIAEQKQLQLQAKQAEEARLAAEKKRRQKVRARKLKKAIKLLAVARALSTLTYIYGKL